MRRMRQGIHAAHDRPLADSDEHDAVDGRADCAHHAPQQPVHRRPEEAPEHFRYVHAQAVSVQVDEKSVRSVNANVTMRRATCTPTIRVHSIIVGLACTRGPPPEPGPRYSTQRSCTQWLSHGICTSQEGSGGGPFPAAAAKSRASESASRPATTPP